MEVFLSIVGCGAGGRELRFRRLKPLTWVFGKKCWHDAYGYMCFGRGGIHFCVAARRLCGDDGAAAVAKGSVFVCKNGDAMLRWLFVQLGLLGGY